MNGSLFTGVCTALVTPFINGTINYPMMDQLIRRQISAGITAIVICGTTGESPTLSDEEKIELFHRSKMIARNRCLIIAGTGSNNTEHTVSLSKEAEDAGVDALLVVSPYYNKPSFEGLFSHYLSVAHAVSIPIIIYNVPSRTGIDIPVELYRRLCKIPNIIGVKEASTDITKISRIKSVCDPDFSVWTGNDDQIVPAIANGCSGVISVLSNVFPEETSQIYKHIMNGNLHSAAQLHRDLLPLIDLLFCESNPIPVKAAMEKIGYDCGKCRLPLSDLSEKNKARLDTYFLNTFTKNNLAT